MKLKVLVKVNVPNWAYCNLQDCHHPRNKVDGYCRFCQEVKRNGEKQLTCTLFNNMLWANGTLVKKCDQCLYPTKKIISD